MKTQVLFGQEAKDKLFAGVEKVFKAVGSTLGPKGRNAVFSKWNQPLVTNDGVSIARRINLEDPFEAMGADLIKQASEKTNEDAGDGTTTACVLAYHLINNGRENQNPVKLRHELEEATRAVGKELDAMTVKVTTDEELLDIACISLEDSSAARFVVDAVKQSGANGRVVVEEWSGTTVEKEDILGMELEGGYVTPLMATKDNGDAELQDCLVLVTDRVLSLNRDIVPIAEAAVKAGKTEMFIICKKLEAEALQTFVMNKVKGKFVAIVVALERDKNILEDIASLVGGVAITAEKGIKDIPASYFGHASKVIVNQKKTLIVNTERGEYAEKAYQDRVLGLQQQLKENAEDLSLKDRLARLTGSIVLIRVGAPTLAERSYLKLKIDDAVGATAGAIESGYVQGGGVSLMTAAERVDQALGTDGSKLLAAACFIPYQTLLLSSELKETEYLTYLSEAHVIDPAKVEKSALANAVSLASIFLTIDTVIVDVSEQNTGKATNVI